MDIAQEKGVDRLMNTQELANYLNIGKRTLQAWRAAGKLPRPDLAIGSTRRWRKETIESWLLEYAGE